MPGRRTSKEQSTHELIEGGLGENGDEQRILHNQINALRESNKNEEEEAKTAEFSVSGTNYDEPEDIRDLKKM